MSNKLETQTGENANVKVEEVIDYSTLDTLSREDDHEQWNSMQFFGEDDSTEREYEPRSEKKLTVKDRERIEKFRGRNMGQKVIHVAALEIA